MTRRIIEADIVEATDATTFAPVTHQGGDGRVSLDGLSNVLSSQRRTFDTVVNLLAHEGPLGPEGSTVRAGGFSYTVAAANATNHHVTTAGGDKLYVEPMAGKYHAEAFSAPLAPGVYGHDQIEAAIVAGYTDGVEVFFGPGEWRYRRAILRKSNSIIKGAKWLARFLPDMSNWEDLPNNSWRRSCLVLAGWHGSSVPAGFEDFVGPYYNVHTADLDITAPPPTEAGERQGNGIRYTFVDGYSVTGCIVRNASDASIRVDGYGAGPYQSPTSIEAIESFWGKTKNGIIADNIEIDGFMGVEIEGGAWVDEIRNNRAIGETRETFHGIRLPSAGYASIINAYARNCANAIWGGRSGIVKIIGCTDEDCNRSVRMAHFSEMQIAHNTFSGRMDIGEDSPNTEVMFERGGIEVVHNTWTRDLDITLRVDYVDGQVNVLANTFPKTVSSGSIRVRNTKALVDQNVADIHPDTRSNPDAQIGINYDPATLEPSGDGLVTAESTHGGTSRSFKVDSGSTWSNGENLDIDFTLSSQSNLKIDAEILTSSSSDLFFRSLKILARVNAGITFQTTSAITEINAAGVDVVLSHVSGNDYRLRATNNTGGGRSRAVFTAQITAGVVTVRPT